MLTSIIGGFPKMRGVTRWLLVVCLVILAAQSASSGESRVVCYYTNWSVYRPGTAKFGPQNINPYLCTHLIYAFGGFTKENTLKPFDKYQDIEKGGYAKFTGLKTYNPNLKTMIAIGGWNEGSSRFSPLVASSERRREFVKNSVKFMRQNKFDGLDLDWEYPSFRDGGKPKDKANYAKFVQELRDEFEKEAEVTGRPRLLLTMAVPAGIEYIDKGYDVAKLNRYLDWMNILTYDYHSAFEPAVNHHAPLYPLEAASEYNYDSELNIDHTIKHYLEAGADREKLVLGIPTYGRSYTLFNPESSAIGSPADGPGAQGDATREKGYLAYYEICENLLPKGRSKRATSDEDDDEDESEEDEEWTVIQPNPNAMGPFAYRGNQWVGYDDIDIVKKKAEYVAEQRLGGIMFWSIDNDDFRGKCHDKPYPLIEAAKHALYKSLGITEKISTPKKTQTSGKRTRPKPSKIDDEEKSNRNSVKTDRYKSRDSDSESTRESTTASSSRRRQNLRRTSTSTTTFAPSEAVTPDWGLNTPEPPTTPDPGTDFKCEEEGFFPHPRDCKKYFWCLDSGPSNLGIVANQFTCPSGLHFNKAADSCDFARNVFCKSKATVSTAPPVTRSTTTAKTTTTTSTTPSPRTTTTQSRISPQLANLFTTRRPLPKITAATSKTTLVSRLLSTTFAPAPVEEYEDEEIAGEDGTLDSEEDPKVIKELIDLIKKLGGVEQLEKYLQTTSNTQGTRNTTPPSVSRLLYERVLSQTRSQGERAPPQINSRGPQAAGLEKFIDSEVKSSRWEKPQYTTINRRKPSTTTEEIETADEKFEEDDEVSEQPSSTVRTNLPQYVNIRRGRPTSTTEAAESTARNALYERGSDETDSDVDDVKNGVQGFEYSNIRRFRPETQEATSPKYKTIQRARPTSTETVPEDNSENPKFRTSVPIEFNSQFVSSTEKPVLTSPKYATVARFPTTISPQTVETTTANTNNNENTESNDVNVDIAYPSFASENGVIKNKDSSVLNAQISLLSNIVKSKDDSSVTPNTTPIVSYSTEVTVSEDPFFSTSKGTPLFVKRTRPTTTSTTTERQETTSQQSSDKKVSFKRVYSNVSRTPAQNRARVSNNVLGQDILVSNSDNLLGETKNDIIEYKVGSRVRKIRSTTPSSQENSTDTANNKRVLRPQIRFGVERSNLNSVLRENNQQSNFRNEFNNDSSATSGESIKKPTFRSRKLQTSNSGQRSDESRSEEVTEATTHRVQPIRRFRPSLRDFGPDLSSLTSLDNSKKIPVALERFSQVRNIQSNRRFRPTYTSTNPPIEDSVDSDSSITPVRTSIQRTFAPRGRQFTTVRTTEKDLDEEASEASIIPRGRKLSIARFTPRPFARVTNEVLDEIDDAEAQEENDLTADVSFEPAPIGKARLTAPVITVSDESQKSSTASLPLSSINVTKVINSNILLGQTNNRSGILLVRRLSKPTNNVNINTTLRSSIDEGTEGIHLSESNIDDKEQSEDNILPVDRPRKRIIVKKLRPRTDTETLQPAATERIEVTSSVNQNLEQIDESTNKDRSRIRKVLRRRPATSTVTPSQSVTTPSLSTDVTFPTKQISDEQKVSETTTLVTRRRKIVRKKLKSVVTEDGKQRTLETKSEAVVDEKDFKDAEIEVKQKSHTEDITSVKPTDSSLGTTTPSVNEDRDANNINNITDDVESSTLGIGLNSTTLSEATKQTDDSISSTEPSTTKTFIRKLSITPSTTPALPLEEETEKPRVESLPRRPVFSARPVNRRPFTTPSTTTTDGEDYEGDEQDEEVINEELPLIFVPVGQFFTRAPVKPVEGNIESEQEEDESEEPNLVPSSPRPVNRFAPGRRPPAIPNRFNPSVGRESNRPVNTPQGVKPTEETNRRFNRPIPFQPNRPNRFGASSTIPPTETTTRSYVRKFTPNRLQSDGPTTENINIEAVSAKHKQLFNNRNRNRFTTLKSSLQSNSESTTEYGAEVTTLGYNGDETTLNYEAETITENEELGKDSEEWLSGTDSTEDSTTEGDWDKWIRNEISIPTDNPAINDIEETTFDPYNYLTTQSNIESNNTVKTSVHLDRLFAVSRVVEVSSKEDKHKLNSKNETRLVEEGKIKQEKKPTLNKIGEVSRFTLIKIVEGDIPIYLTNLSREYPVENPPFNPITIDEARNARSLNEFTDSGKENLIASESVNAAYNHKNGVIELIQTPVELDYKTDTDDKGNKVYVIESTTVLDNTEMPTETEPTETETYMTTNDPIVSVTERMFVPAAIDVEELRNKNVNVVTPKYVESATIALEALFGSNDTIYTSNSQSKTVSGPQPFVVYASPILLNDDQQSQTTLSNTSDPDSKKEPSGRSLEGFVKIQIVGEEDNIKTFVKGEEFQGKPAALDVITEKGSSSTVTTTETIKTMDLSNQTSEESLIATSIATPPAVTVLMTTENVTETSKGTTTIIVPLVSTTMAIIELNATDDSVLTKTSTASIKIEENTQNSTIEQNSTPENSTTPIPEVVKSTLVKTLSSSIPTNSSTSNFTSNFIKNRPKLSFPRRHQSNTTSSSVAPRIPFNPLVKSNKNRAVSVTLDAKNIPYTTPKYNRTNSYTSGKSRFSATRTQNVPVDTRKGLETNKFKPSTTTTAAPSSSKIVNVPVESTTAKVTIRRFKPRVSSFGARRTSTTTESSAQDETTDTPSNDNTVVTERFKNPSARPTFFPRRNSNRFSDRSRSTVATTTPPPVTESTTSRFSSLRRRPPSTFARKYNTSSTQGADSTTTEIAEASTARPNRLVVRKYYNKQRGSNGGATQSNANTDEGSQSSTKAPNVSSRKPFRVGVRRRIPTRVSTVTSQTTSPAVETTQYDQEYLSTVQQNHGKDSTDFISKKDKSSPSNTNELIPNREDQGINDEAGLSGINKGKKYSSVIKEDKTLVQQEVTSTGGPKEGLIGSVGNDVTADVAIAAHQLLSAPLPTIPSYAKGDQDYPATGEEGTFTRAYLLASISPPIISNDYVSTTEAPLVVTKFNFPTRGRRISTTNTPQIVYSSTFSPAPVRRRKPQTPAAFEKILPVTNNYRKVIDYEYYDDDDTRLVNNAEEEKVIVRGTGVIQCMDQGNFAHPKSCKKFISCAKMETGGIYGWEYTCPKGLSFDPVGGICNWSAGLGCNDH